MEQKTISEPLGGTYSQQRDYLLRILTLPDTKKCDWQVRTSATKISEEFSKRMDILVKAMAKQEGVTEALKAADQKVWVRRMNHIRNRAEEIILNEILYVQQQPVVSINSLTTG